MKISSIVKNGVTGKFGIDGSGTHKVRHQLVNELLSLLENPHLDPKKTSSFLLSGYCPLKITCLHGDEENVVWRNPLPNSTVFARPVSLTRCKDREIIEAEMAGPFEIIKDYFLKEFEFNEI